MIPDNLRRALETSVSWPVPWEELNVVLGRVPPMALVPSSMIRRRSLTRVVARARATSPMLRVIGATIGDTVYLDIRPEDLSTAAGLALAVHEFYHVQQAMRIPNFDERYLEYAAQTPPDQPWLNPLELEAYRVEADEYCRLVALGYPPGRWKPLGVELWGCD